MDVSANILRIDCPDEKGIVFKVTGVLYDAGFNIISNHEFVDSESGHFFMRTELAGADAPARIVSEIVRVLPTGANVRLASTEPQPIVILATKEPHCIGDLLLRHDCGELPAVIRAVISNHDSLSPLVARFG